MDKAHEHHLPDVHRLIGILPQKVGHDSHVPGVLCVIFPPAVTRQMGLAQDVFLLIEFQNKAQLLPQSFFHGFLPFSEFLNQVSISLRVHNTYFQNWKLLFLSLHIYLMLCRINTRKIGTGPKRTGAAAQDRPYV